jgi:hypothetical protein
LGRLPLSDPEIPRGIVVPGRPPSSTHPRDTTHELHAPQTLFRANESHFHRHVTGTATDTPSNGHLGIVVLCINGVISEETPMLSVSIALHLKLAALSALLTQM